MKTATIDKSDRETATPRVSLVPGIRALGRSRVVGQDGPIGRLRDLYFDDQSWTVRYLVVDIARGLPPRRILVSPISVVAIDARNRLVTTALTRSQAAGSPG